MTIRIITDSACDLPEAIASKYNITIVPLTFSIGDQEFVDRTSLTIKEFWRRCAESPVLPQTAAPAPGKFAEAYKKLVAEGATGILMVGLSRELSATIQSAETGAKESGLNVPIKFIDSRSASMGEGINVIMAAQLLAENPSMTLDQLATTTAQWCEKTRVFGALDTLENLKKGGRVSGAKAFLASALAIKPIIEVRDGKIMEGGKERTRSKALAFLVDKVKSAGPITNLAVLHAECTDLEAFVGQLKDVYSGEIITGDIGSVIGSHTGIGTIAVTFHVK